MDKTDKKVKRKVARKEEIISAAVKLFCKQGYEKTTVDDIVEKVGCSHGLFYHYFGSKKDILNAILAEKEFISDKEHEELLKSDKDYTEKLRFIIENIYKHLKTDKLFAYSFYIFVQRRFSLRDKTKAENCVNDCKKSKCNHPVIMLENFFRAGQNAGEFRTDYTPRECTEMFISIIQGATLGYVIAPKDMRRTMRFPNTDFIIDIYAKTDTNTKGATK